MTMTVEEARAHEWPAVETGERYNFYCEMQQEYEPPDARLCRFTGQKVEVVRGPLGPDENDPDNSPLYEVRAEDGTIFQAWQEELNGWDKALGQFYGPSGIWGSER